MEDFPKISIVIVNLNGERHLPMCLKSIEHLRYPKDKLEIIVVDNGSSDGSVEYLERKWKNVRLLKNSSNQGFAQPSDDGAAVATGDYVAFLNNDMRVERTWLQELLATRDHTGADCIGSTILSWDGRKIDFVGGGLTFYGRGHQYHYGEPAADVEKVAGGDPAIMFACGGAMLISKKVFEEVGGFDGDFFAYFEDVDLGWRLWNEGYTVRLSTHSVVYHKHNSTSKTFDSAKIAMLNDRNMLYAAYKNYSDALLQKLFWPAVLVEMRAVGLSSGIDSYAFEIQNPQKLHSDGIRIRLSSAARLTALNEFVRDLPKLDAKRRQIQQKRKISDEQVQAFFKKPYVVFPQDPVELINSEYHIVKSFGVEKTIGKELKLRVLLISNDMVGKKMAGPGIRYWEMAKSLAKTGRCQVVLACPGTCDIEDDSIEIVSYSDQDYGQVLKAAAEANVLMVQGFVLDVMPALRRIAQTKYVIVDIYDPFMIESIEVFREKDRGFRNARHKEALTSLKYQLLLGDFFVCANEKQKDYWIGMLSALNRVTPQLSDVDRSGDKLVGIVPFGVSDTDPKHDRPVLKGVWPGIRKTDKVLIWGGGVWNWFDPLTLIRAVKLLSEQRDDVKLFFMGVRHPNPGVPQMQMLTDAVKLAKKLGVYDRFVFFNFDWVDYSDRQNYLLESDLGVSCHFHTLETRFSFRTRILDYLWADLPIICTKGDYFADLVSNQRLGVTVDYQNVQQLADAIVELLDNPDEYARCKKNVRRVSDSYRWSRVTKPIIEFCDNPIHLGMRGKEKVKKEEPEWNQEWNLESEENSPSLLARHHAAGRHRVSVQDRIDLLQIQQRELNQSVQYIRWQNRKLFNVAVELQQWSYMMNNRFNRFKLFFHPFHRK